MRNDFKRSTCRLDLSQTLPFQVLSMKQEIRRNGDEAPESAAARVRYCYRHCRDVLLNAAFAMRLVPARLVKSQCYLELKGAAAALLCVGRRNTATKSAWDTSNYTNGTHLKYIHHHLQMRFTQILTR